MKGFLLKIARKINKKYGIVIDVGDSIYFNGKMYKFVKSEYRRDLNGSNELTITFRDFTPLYHNNRRDK